jgi:RNA polymerase sigma-70 factor, ECF subfamily
LKNEAVLKTFPGFSEGARALPWNFGALAQARPAQGMEIRTEQDNEREMILRGQKGDRQAFEYLYLRHHRGLFLFLVSMLRCRHSAEDVVQDVFVKLFSEIRSYRFQSSFGHWLFRVGRNAAIDRIRREKLRRAFSLDATMEDAHPLLERLADSGPLPSEKPENDEQRRSIDRAMDKLPASHKAVLVMREWEQMKYEEIAAKLGISTGTVKSRIFRGRKLLAGELKEDWEKN